MIRAENTRANFGIKHDMKSPCPVPDQTQVRVRVAGLDHTFVGRAEEFNWVAPEAINPMQPWMVNTYKIGMDNDCALAACTVAEYEVLN